MPAFFPWWVVVTHFLNLFFLLLLMRSGIEVLSAFPKLYWNDDCPPGAGVGPFLQEDVRRGFPQAVVVDG